jgi:hypothetical protein
MEAPWRGYAQEPYSAGLMLLVAAPVRPRGRDGVPIGHRGRTLEKRAPAMACVSTQPVKRGTASFLAQRWNESRSFFGFVWLAFWNVTETTRRWTPTRSLSGLMRTE